MRFPLELGRHWRIGAAAVAIAVIAAAALLLLPGQGTEAALTWTALRNATYPSELPRSKEAHLVDGVYEEEIAPGAATKLRIQLADIAGFGRLDGNDSIDAAVVLIGSPGGSGTFIYLVAVLNEHGSVNPVASVLLGDRVAVRSISIESQKIIVGMRVRGPGDPLALLTREVTRTYSLRDGQLVLESEQAVDVPSAPPNQFAYEPQRLAVEAGKTASRQGTLAPGELATYLLHAEAGQQLVLGVKSQFNNAVLSVQGLEDGVQLVSRSSYQNAWSGRLPSTQDYAVTVVTLAGNDLKYELTLELKAAPTVVPSATPRQAPPPTRVPGEGALPPSVPSILKGQFRPEQRRLAELSAGAAQFLDARSPPWSVAVASPGGSKLYSQNGDAQLELASTVKVLIALAVMDAAQNEGRYVDRFELSLLWPMITLSDNDSATRLWDQIGGGRGLARYLAGIGVTGISPYDGPFWGTTTASANGLAIVLARSAFGDLLGPEHRALFLNLLENVSPSQRWGVSAGAEGEGGAGDLVGLKNGWYPADAGWRVNSIGFVVSRSSVEPYVIAVLTNEQPAFEYGIQTIEGVAERVHSSLRAGEVTLPRQSAEGSQAR